jgi:Ser/Thr protein kinase RdoA (MazF antagonist)
MLDSDVATYLVERELLSAAAIVDGRLRVVDLSRRNRVFLVVTDNERSFVVKFASHAGGAAMAREAAVLARLRALDRELASRLPVLVAHDGVACVLVLEAPPDARDLTRQHAGGRYSRALAREAGRGLAHLHAIPAGALGDAATASDPRWALRLHEPDVAMLRTLSMGSVEVIRIVQASDEICTGLGELLASWQERSIVHGDIRWENVLALRDRGSKTRSRLLLIDWEQAGAGDPALDVGAFLGEYLHAWLRSVPIVDSRDPGRLLGEAGRPLARMLPPVRAFCEGYARAGARTAPELRDLLTRAVRFAAARLVAAALEEAQTRTDLGGSVLFTLQLAANVFGRPDEAAQLLGLPAP